jgi:hypothetical protein
MIGFVMTAAWTMAALIFAAGDQSRWHLPVTIEVARDVDVRSSERQSDGRYGQLRGTLYSSEAFLIKKHERFQMVKIYTEGECRIRFQGKEYDLHSCPWLDGFRDHQADIFRVSVPTR